MQALKTDLLDRLKKNPDAKSPEAEVDQILFHVFRKRIPRLRSPRDLYLESLKATAREITDAIFIAEERAKGVPLQHLLGYQFFYAHEYQVNSSTLIPRPETEILVDSAISWLHQTFGTSPFRFAELGLGSGILSAEILSHFPNARGMASEASSSAIELAHENLKSILGPEYPDRLHIHQSKDPSLGFEVFLSESPFDLVISNPPYLQIGDEMDFEVLQFEPASALFPISRDPDFFYSNFLSHASALIHSHGAAFFEIPHERAERLLDLFLQSELKGARLISDLTGRPRVLFATRNEVAVYSKESAWKS